MFVSFFISLLVSDSYLAIWYFINFSNTKSMIIIKQYKVKDLITETLKIYSDIIAQLYLLIKTLSFSFYLLLNRCVWLKKKLWLLKPSFCLQIHKLKENIFEAVTITLKTYSYHPIIK